MNLSEVRDIIARSQENKWFQSIEAVFNYSHYCNFNQTFIGVASVYSFIKKQVESWWKHKEKLPPQLQSSLNYFTNIENQLNILLNSHQNSNQQTLNNFWQQNIQWTISSLHQYPFPYHTNEASLLLKISNELWIWPEFEWAFWFIINWTIQTSGNRKATVWAILAYEYLTKDYWNIIKRKNDEKRSLNDLKRDYIKLISEWTNQATEEIKKVTLESEEYTKRIDVTLKNKEGQFENLFEETKEKQNQLNETYGKLLMLKEPAKYWDDRSAILYSKWNNFAWALGLIILTVCLLLYFLIFSTPEAVIKMFLNENYVASIKWSIIFIIFISFFIFLVRILTRVMLSNYHLASDAKERSVLTYFYLSLSKEVSVEQEEKLIVMQSLFSRSDSGLLNTDTSPTLPWIIESILKK